MFLSLWFAAVLWASQPVADLLQQADDAHDLGKFAEAWQKYDEVVKADPRFEDRDRLITFSNIDPRLAPPGSSFRTDAQALLRLRTHAEDALLRFLQRHPDDAKVLDAYVSVAVETGHRAGVEDLLRRRPNDPVILRAGIGFASRISDFPMALSVADKLSSVPGATAEDLYVSGIVDYEIAAKGEKLDNQERMAAARKGVETLQKALKLKPDYFEAMSYLSLLLRQEARFTSDGQQQKALTDQADQWRAKGLEELKKKRTQQP